SYESISGNTIGGRKLSGKERILRGVFGTLDLALAGYSGVKGFRNRGSKVPEIPEKAGGANLNKLKPNEINNMSLDELRNSIPDDWQIFENNGRVHIKDSFGTDRVKIDPPDKVTNYDHMHIFDADRNPLDINGNIINRKSPDAHIPWTKK
ncbi:hypothetical protein ACWOFR_18350, partial [Carnobacterium gallinarum]